MCRWKTHTAFKPEPDEGAGHLSHLRDDGKNGATEGATGAPTAAATQPNEAHPPAANRCRGAGPSGNSGPTAIAQKYMPAGPAGILVAAVGDAASLIAQCCACSTAAACSAMLAFTRICVIQGGSSYPKGAGVNATPGGIAARSAIAVGAGAPKPAGTAYRTANSSLGPPRTC